jgi:hypothetical protein
MPEGYCCKCKRKRKIADAVESVTRHGRTSLTGMCSVCGAEVFLVVNATQWTPAAHLPVPSRPLAVGPPTPCPETHA